MIIDQTNIAGIALFSKSEPFLTFLHNLMSFKIKVTTNDSFKTFGRILDILSHCEFHITISNYIGISLVFLLSFLSALLMFESRLIKIDIFTHDDSLDRQKNLKESGDFRIPVFRSRTSPSSEKREADFTTRV